MGASWFEQRWALDEVLRHEAKSWPTEERAWAESTDEGLLVWIAAQRCLAPAERMALMQTVTETLERTLGGIEFDRSDLLVALRDPDEDNALTVFMVHAYARACEAMVQARRLNVRLERLETRGMGERAAALWPRAVEHMIDSLRAAQGAFGHRAERDGGVRARTTTPASMIRDRHAP